VKVDKTVKNAIAKSMERGCAFDIRGAIPQEKHIIIMACKLCGKIDKTIVDF
jgi:hypothetical protein